MEFESFNNFSNIFVFDTKIDGPTIVIFGGIHGNEIAGVKVIDNLLNQLKNDEIKLLKGKLILAYGNEQAIKIGKRQVKYNLNRLFLDKYFSNSSNDYEINRVKELKEILIEGDILLDIHSTSSESVPFMFAENFMDEINIARNIGPKKIIVGWEEISGNLIGGDTNNYMHKLGKNAFTLECGQHNSRNAFDIGYNTSIKLLEYFGLLKGLTISELQKIDLVNMYKIKTTKTGNFNFKEKINNFDYIKSGELIGFDGNKKIIAEEDFIILLPNYEKTVIGEEIFYYGK